MPTVTQYYDAYGRLYEYYQNGSTHITQNSTTTQYWNVLSDQYQLTGGPTVVANSPYVIEDWRTWNTSTSTSVTQNIYYPIQDTWREWCTTPSIYANGVYQGNGALREPTPEELAAQKAAEAKRARAKVRARSLLDSVLTPEQRQYMERHGYIPVVGSKGRRYHIRTTGGASGNVALVDDKEAVLGRFCAHPTSAHGPIPTEDSFVAQLLHLQDDEDDFLHKANLVEGKNPVRRALLSVA
jgi:hypothetical protein